METSLSSACVGGTGMKTGGWQGLCCGQGSARGLVLLCKHTYGACYHRHPCTQLCGFACDYKVEMELHGFSRFLSSFSCCCFANRSSHQFFSLAFDTPCIIQQSFTFHSTCRLFQQSSKPGLFLFSPYRLRVQDPALAPGAMGETTVKCDPRYQFFSKPWIFGSAVIIMQGQSKLTLQGLVTSRGLKCDFHSLFTAPTLEVLSR